MKRHFLLDIVDFPLPVDGENIYIHATVSLQTAYIIQPTTVGVVHSLATKKLGKTLE